MMEKGYAAAWEDFDHVRTMQQVRRGDVVLLYANKVGIIAIGLAKGKCEPVGRRDSRRLFKGIPDQEWQIPVRWTVQVRDEDACPWPNVLPPTFQDVSGDRWSDQRNTVIRRFPDIVEELALLPPVPFPA